VPSVLPPERHTERGFDRIVNFSDAVVAIAITLLVLPLVDIVGEVGDSSRLADVAQENIPSFIAFVVTFLVAANFWMVHHRIFERLADYSSGLIWLSFGWLLCMVFLPVPSAVVSEYGFADGAGLLYCGVMALIALLQSLMAWHASRRPKLLAPDIRPQDLHWTWSLYYSGVFLGIGVISLWLSHWASWGLLLLIPLGRWLNRRQ
jgi:uncharacterized membrane protein